jgi:hypothetical protein
MTEYVNAVITHDQVSHSPSYGSVIALKDGRLMWASGSGSGDPVNPLQAVHSSDGGATWPGPVDLKYRDGQPVLGVMDVNLLRLHSGALGLAHRSAFPPAEERLGNYTGRLSFHRSDDEGETWSQPVPINPPGTHAVFTNDKSIVLRDGRIVVPFYGSIGPRLFPFEKFSMQLGEKFNNAERGVMAYGATYYSDDEGETWTRSLNEVHVTLDHGALGRYSLGEPTVVELDDGRVLMLGRTNLGTFYRCYSEDRGETWSEPVASGLACPPSPCSLIKLPGTGDLMVAFNQISRWETMSGLYRHRLSCAISRDEGKTWENHRNLESLDDVSYIEPGGPEPVLMGRPKQPVDRSRYHRAPGPLRFSYPSATLVGDKVVITYGMSVFGDKSIIADTFGVDYDQLMEKLGLAPYDFGNKVRVLTTEWFYE